MKYARILFAFLAIAAPTANAEPEPKMIEQTAQFNTPEETLHAYEQSLSRQSWEAVKDLIHEDAVFIFTESTFRGKEEIRQAFEKTFNLIKEEKYWITNLS